jgi:carbamate kinase
VIKMAIHHPLLLVAVGGNALVQPGQAGGSEQQFENALAVAGSLVELVAAGCGLLITHGNGPQVGAALIRSEAAAPQAYRLPYDCCVAATQGEIGYVLQFALWQRMQQLGLRVPVVTLVTQVRVDPHDPAFAHPTKPIGPLYPRVIAERHRRDLGWTLVDVAGGGSRRVVASPRPQQVVELEAIRACLSEGLVVIAAGGGGVPVFNDHDVSKGVEAVIDKDLTSALLANQIGVDLFVIATSVDRVCVDYGTPGERPLDRLTLDEGRRLLSQGQFPEGSMGPKVAAALEFVERTGREAIITSARLLLAAVEGRAGTHVLPSSSGAASEPGG